MSATPPLRLAITPGELAGIGPDLVIQLAQKPHDHEWVVIADPDAIMARAKTLQLPLNCHPFDANHFRASGLGNISVLAQTASAASPPGEASTDNANYLLECLDAAIDGCQKQLFSALVTGPLNKHIINAAGIPFSGHTEYLAEKTRCKQVVMMLASEQLRVALLTTHLPLRDVSDAITADSLESVITTLRGELKRYFCTHEPHILVAGLNPHAGEQGSMGREEIDIISPTLSTLRDKGFSLEGPLPADTLFTKPYLDRADAILAMYHDQGLPVLKYQSFGRAVNISLGLPIIRTSVDHGTAFDLAGSGRADTGSFAYAISVACRMASHHQKHSAC